MLPSPLSPRPAAHSWPRLVDDDDPAENGDHEAGHERHHDLNRSEIMHHEVQLDERHQDTCLNAGLRIGEPARVMHDGPAGRDDAENHDQCDRAPRHTEIAIISTVKKIR